MLKDDVDKFYKQYGVLIKVPLSGTILSVLERKLPPGLEAKRVGLQANTRTKTGVHQWLFRRNKRPINEMHSNHCLIKLSFFDINGYLLTPRAYPPLSDNSLRNRFSGMDDDSNYYKLRTLQFTGVASKEAMEKVVDFMERGSIDSIKYQSQASKLLISFVNYPDLYHNFQRVLEDPRAADGSFLAAEVERSHPVTTANNLRNASANGATRVVEVRVDSEPDLRAAIELAAKYEVFRQKEAGDRRSVAIEFFALKNACGYVKALIAPDGLAGGKERLKVKFLPDPSCKRAPVYPELDGFDGSNTVFLTNLPAGCQARDIFSVVKGGEVLLLNHTRRKRYAHLTFTNPGAADLFAHYVNHHSVSVAGSLIRAEKSKHRVLRLEDVIELYDGATRSLCFLHVDQSLLRFVSVNQLKDRLSRDLTRFGDVESHTYIDSQKLLFVNYSSVQDCVRTLEAVRGDEFYRNYNVAFGKDKCDNEGYYTLMLEAVRLRNFYCNK